MVNANANNANANNANAKIIMHKHKLEILKNGGSIYYPDSIVLF